MYKCSDGFDSELATLFFLKSGMVWTIMLRKMSLVIMMLTDLLRFSLSQIVMIVDLKVVTNSSEHFEKHRPTLVQCHTMSCIDENLYLLVF